MNVEPYLFFNGRCEEALQYYARALDARITAKIRYAESPTPPTQALPPGWSNKLMHANLQVGATTLMASDGTQAGGTQFGGFALTLSLPDEDTARRYFDNLAAGGKVRMALARTFWSPLFGMVTDRFGLDWMVSVFRPQDSDLARQTMGGQTT